MKDRRKSATDPSIKITSGRAGKKITKGSGMWILSGYLCMRNRTKLSAANQQAKTYISEKIPFLLIF